MLHVGEQLRMADQEALHSCFRRRLVGGLGRDAVENGGGAQEASRRQVFLFPVVVGDAVRHEADLAGDVGEGRALDASLVEEQRPRIQDQLALFFEALRLNDRGKRTTGHAGRCGRALR